MRILLHVRIIVHVNLIKLVIQHKGELQMSLSANIQDEESHQNSEFVVILGAL